MNDHPAFNLRSTRDAYAALMTSCVLIEADLSARLAQRIAGRAIHRANYMSRVFVSAEEKQI